MNYVSEPSGLRGQQPMGSAMGAGLNKTVPIVRQKLEHLQKAILQSHELMGALETRLLSVTTQQPATAEEQAMAVTGPQSLAGTIEKMAEMVAALNNRISSQLDHLEV